MNLSDIYKAIYTRALADTGAGGLFPLAGSALITGFYSQMAVPGNSAVYPYVYCDIESTSNQDAFPLDLVELTFRLHVVAEVATGQAAVQAIIARLYGNGRTPTYGFHRHLLAIAAGGWTGGVCERVDSTSNNDEDIFHHIETYRTRISRAA